VFVSNNLSIIGKVSNESELDVAAELGDGTQGCRQLILQGVVQ
jgi:hypothetical protein